MAYSPEGFGPLRLDLGLLILAYHDASQSRGFYRDGLQTVEVGDLGTSRLPPRPSRRCTGCSSRSRSGVRNGRSTP